MNLTKFGPIIQASVSVLVLGAFFGVTWALLFLKSDISGGVREVLLVLVGVLAGAFKDVVGYWIGSSLGSSQKTEIINKGTP